MNTTQERTDNSAPTSKTAAPNGAFALLRAELQRSVSEEGYTTPTPIQEQCINHLLEGRDLIGSAQTGTGKTAAFTLPLLHRLIEKPLRAERNSPRALILAPSRELAAQIGDSIETYGRHLKIRHTVIFGGVSQHRQVQALTRGVDIVVATPGRLLDLMNQKKVYLDKIEFFILDEVDRMLDMGFINDIKKVLKQIPPSRQTLFFSATLAPKMEQLAKTMVKNPVRITITPDEPTVDRIKQKVLFMDKKHKDKILVEALEDPTMNKAIIFTQMKHSANKVVAKLESAGITCSAIHGNKSQAARTKALDAFRSGRIKVLVATDVAARGIDVDDVTHVINYDLPVEAETYVHRIGRTARAGASGVAISFCTPEVRAYLKSIEKLLGREVPVDKDHGHHCERAQFSTMAAPKQGGGGGGGRGGFGGKRGGGNRGGGRPGGGGGGSRGGARRSGNRGK